MKLMFLSDLWQPFPGGAERYVFNMARELHKRGHDMTALTSYAKASTHEDINVMVQDIGVTSNDRHAEGWVILQSLLQVVKPDVILTHHFFAYEFEVELRENGIPVVQLIYNNYRIPSVAFAVYISQYVWNHSGGREGDLLIHPPAYDDIVAETHGNKVGFIKPIHHKGVDYIYRLAAYFPNLKFVILRGEWQTNEDIRPMPNIEFMEPVKDMREFYKKCRIILMPSWNEDAGTVAQEAAKNGLPCISTAVMGLAETNGGGIRLERNEDHWRAELTKLCNSPAYYKEVVERQYTYLETFQWDQKFDVLSEKLSALCR